MSAHGNLHEEATLSAACASIQMILEKVLVVLLKLSHNSLIHGLLELLVLEAASALVEVAADASPDCIAISCSCFAKK